MIPSGAFGNDSGSWKFERWIQIIEYLDLEQDIWDIYNSDENISIAALADLLRPLCKLNFISEM